MIHTKIIFVSCFVIIVSTVTLGVFWSQMSDIRKKQDESITENRKTRQFLMSTLDWSSQRNKTVLYMRDRIAAEWVRVGLKPDYDLAYRKAEAITVECERYPNLDPFLLLAINCVESSHLDSVRDSTLGGKKRVMTSSTGARGSWQFVQSTARIMCAALGMDYSERIYTDVQLSTRMAAKYLSILETSYGNDTAVVADYNGGPWQAIYSLKDRSRLSPETKKFIPDVLGKMTEYKNGFPLYQVDVGSVK